MVKDFIDALRANEYVREKELGDGISSFNFTNKAFWKGHWDNETVKARGLFIDTNRNEIVARGYDKFFTLEEHERLQLACDLKYPIEISRKENGYLGLFSATKNGNPFFASKSTNQGWFANEFERILRDKLGDNLDDFVALAANENLTFVFEVISMDDPHIIAYDHEDVVLLDIIYNRVNFVCCEYRTLARISKTFGLSVREKPVIVHNDVELIQQMQFADEDKTEGFVARDANGFMFKYKSYYYRYWKNLRGVMQQLWVGKQSEDIARYEERCMEEVHAAILPHWVNMMKKTVDDCPHIFDYQKFMYDNYSNEIHDIQ